MKLSNYQDISIGQGICKTFWSEVNIYLYVIDGLLVDTGPATLGKESISFFKQHKINQVALSHLHEDHSGMASWLQKDNNISIYLHPGAVPYAQQKVNYPLYRHYHWGNRRPFSPEPMPETITTAKYSFQTIDSPGHTAFHSVLFEKSQGWLFTGDLYLGTKALVAFFEENMQDTISSLKKLLQLDFDTIFCAHAGVIPKGKKKLQRKLDFLEALHDEVTILRKQGLSNREIDAKIFPGKRLVTIVSRGEWSSYNIINTL